MIPEKLASAGADVLGLDWTVEIGKVRNALQGKTALQGNLDPTILYANKDKIRSETIKILESYGYGNGHIFNLGHGILPDVEPENAKALVDFVKVESPRFHMKESLSKGK